MSAVISAVGLHRTYGRGRDAFEAVRGVDIEVGEGEIFALLGTNGAGKTSTLDLLEGLAAPTAGELALPPRETLGFLAHEPLVYRELTPLENLQLFARLYRIDRAAPQDPAR